MHAHTHAHAHKCTCAHSHMHSAMCTPMHAHARTRTLTLRHTHTQTHLHTHTCTHMHVCTHTLARPHTCMHTLAVACTFAHPHTHTPTHTCVQTHVHAHAHTHQRAAERQGSVPPEDWLLGTVAAWGSSPLPGPTLRLTSRQAASNARAGEAGPSRLPLVRPPSSTLSWGARLPAPMAGGSALRSLCCEIQPLPAPSPVLAAFPARGGDLWVRTLGAPSSCGQRTRVSSSQRLPNLPGLGFSPPRNPVRDLGPEAEEGGCSLDDRASRAPGQLGARGPVHRQRERLARRRVGGPPNHSAPPSSVPPSLLQNLPNPGTQKSLCPPSRVFI